MSQTKNFTAKIISGTTGPLINVKGEVNCGMTEVQPTLTKRTPQGFNRYILLLDVWPASDDANGSFRKAEYSENITEKGTYTQVQLFDPAGNIVETIPVH